MAGLQELKQAYEADRAEMDARHPPIADSKRCRYCGGTWQHWARGKFPGHVRCVVSRSFVQLLASALKRDHRLTYLAVAVALEVNPAVVRAWWDIANRQEMPSR